MRNLLIYSLFICFAYAASVSAQEVPGTVVFKPIPKEEQQALPPETPFRKPAEPATPPAPKVPDAKEAKPPQAPQATTPPAPAVPNNAPNPKAPMVGEQTEEGKEPVEEKAIRRAPAEQRRKVLPPPGMETKVEAPKPVPEGRSPVSLVDASPVVFSLADIAVYPWMEKEEYFEDDPTKVTMLKARIQRSDQVILPDYLSRAPFPDGQGVLTILPDARMTEISLEKVFFSQDIIFLDDEGLILQLVYKTEIKGKKPVVSRFPVRSILQLNSGSIRKYALKTGDKIAIPPRL